MAAYLVERVARSLLVLLGVVLVSYALVLLTGDPAGTIAGPDASPADVEQIRRELGYDQPLPIRGRDAGGRRRVLRRARRRGVGSSRSRG